MTESAYSAIAPDSWTGGGRPGYYLTQKDIPDQDAVFLAEALFGRAMTGFTIRDARHLMAYRLGKRVLPYPSQSAGYSALGHVIGAGTSSRRAWKAEDLANRRIIWSLTQDLPLEAGWEERWDAPGVPKSRQVYSRTHFDLALV
ncbi:MAG: hypothetical protein ACYDD0_03890 [Candidatus Dormibacteria bacterium]